MFCIYKYSFEVLSSECPKGMQSRGVWAVEGCICVDVTKLSEHRQTAKFEDVYPNVLLYII